MMKTQRENYPDYNQVPDPLLPLPAVLTVVGVGESTWHAGVISGRFPLPVKCGRRSFWPQSTIAQLIQSLKAGGG